MVARFDAQVRERSRPKVFVAIGVITDEAAVVHRTAEEATKIDAIVL
jgi:hypothetical protein